MIAAFLILATIALVVLKAAGILAISWVVAVLPALVLLALGLIALAIFAALTVVGKRQIAKAEAEAEERRKSSVGARYPRPF